MKTFPEYNTPEWENMSCADHAEAWWQEQGNVIPEHKTPEWDEMYLQWVDFAWSKLPE